MHECLSFNNLSTFQYCGLSNRHLFFDELITINNINHYIFTDGSKFISFIYIGNKEIDFDKINSFTRDNAHLFIIHKEDDSAAIYYRNFTDDSFYFKYGYLHRNNDLPALIKDKSAHWFQYGLEHRKYSPSYTDFTYDHQEIFTFHIYGSEISEDKFDDFEEKTESVIIDCVEHEKYSNSLGQEIYFLNGKIHREDDKPAYISNEQKRWYKNGIIHRLYKPALVYLTGKCYRVSDKGSYSREFYIKKGKELNESEIKKEIIIGNVNLF